MHDEHPLPASDVVVEGVRLSVVRHGRDAHADEPVVLMLHGLGESGRVWFDVARDIEHEHRCVIPDLAGCGRSEVPSLSARCTSYAQAELLLSLLDELGHGQAAVVGHGLGGAVAVHLAVLAPQRVRALVLVGSAPYAELWPPRDVAPLLMPTLGGAYAWVRRRAGAGDLTERRRAAMAVDADADEAALRLLAAEPPPTLVLWGETDSQVPTSYGRRLAGEIRGASWVPVVGAGHGLPVEWPERVAEEISGFLAELPTPA